MPIGLLILLMLIGVPLLEIAVFIEVGSWIGVFPTIALTIATAMAGTVMLRMQGVTLLTRMRGEMDAGRTPGEDLVQGALMVVASILLLIPGFVTDFIGLLLFVPPLRAAAARYVVARANVTVVQAGGARTRGGRVVDLDEDGWTSRSASHDRDGAGDVGAQKKISPWNEDGNQDGSKKHD